MSDPYAFPTAQANQPPRLSLMTLIGIAFAVFMVWQISTTIGESQEELDTLVITAGDEIEYDYTSRLPDGRVVSTTKEAVAREANQNYGLEMQPSFSYVPQRATVDPNAPGLPWGAIGDEAVVGGFVGQTVTFTVPGDQVGGWEPFTPGGDGIPRELLPQSFQRTAFLQEPAAAAQEGNAGSPGFNLTSLDTQIGPLSDGFIYNAEREFPPSWDIVIEDVNFDNRSLLFRHTVQDGDFFDVPSLPGGVTVLVDDNETQVTYRLDLTVGETFVVEPQGALNQAGFQPGSYRVQDSTDELIFLEYSTNQDPSAVGLPLTVELTIVDKVADGEPAPPGAGPTTGGDAGHTHGPGDDGHTH